MNENNWGDSVKIRIALLMFLVVASVMGCGEKEQMQMPPTEVVVDRVVSVPFKPRRSFVGRLEARQDVRIQAQVSGYLRGRYFREGELVKEKTLLYAIDSAPFEAELAQAKADVARAEANRKVAELNFNRGKRLVSTGAISQSQMDDLTGKRLETIAALTGAEANLKRAEVNLGYTRIHAPFTGRIGRSNFDVGDLVGPEFGALTTLVDVDFMQATFQVSERILMEAEQERATAVAKAERNHLEVPKAVIYIELANNTVYPHVGSIDYVANRIDEKTGTIEVRASIPNPERKLRPGQYVRVVVEIPEAMNVLMIPQAAVQADQKGTFVLTVNADGLVQREDVELDQRVEEKVVVRSGLKEGEQVIVRGLQKARPGQIVVVKSISATENTAKDKTETAPETPAIDDAKGA
jgi:membrane fusion protein (multidrug efflux system)